MYYVFKGTVAFITVAEEAKNSSNYLYESLDDLDYVKFKAALVELLSLILEGAVSVLVLREGAV